LKLEKLKAENPEFCYISNTESLFFFIVVIAFYEMLTKPGLLKMELEYC